MSKGMQVAFQKAAKENRLFPHVSRKNTAHNILNLAHWNPLQTSDFQNCKIINEYCFKPPYLW